MLRNETEFFKVESGVYAHPTGIKIRKRPAHREFGYPVGLRWEVLYPEIGGMKSACTTRSLEAARRWAWRWCVPSMRARILDDMSAAYAAQSEFNA